MRFTSLITVLVITIAALGGLLFGYDTGIIAPAMVFVKTQFHLSIFQRELVVSMVIVGAVVAAGVSGKLADYYGRRRLLLWVAVLFMLGSLITALADTVSFILLGRFILGLAIGVASYVAPLYISEIAAKQNRGALVIVNTVMVTGGIVVSYLIGLWLSTYVSWCYSIIFFLGDVQVSCAQI